MVASSQKDMGGVLFEMSIDTSIRAGTRGVFAPRVTLNHGKKKYENFCTTSIWIHLIVEQSEPFT